MVNIDGSLFIQIANFLILIWALNVVLYKPIRNVLLQRNEKITGLEENIETSNNEAKKKEEAFISGLKDARAKGMKEKEKLMQAAVSEEKQIISKINQRAAEELAEVREKVAEETDNVRNALLGELDTFAFEIGKKILGRSIR